MRYKTHVGLVNAHAERDGGHHHDAVFLLKTRLMFGARSGIHARVIRQGAHALGFEPRCGFIHFFPRQTIHNARVSCVIFLDETQQLCACLVFIDNGVADIGSIKAGDEYARLIECKPQNDFIARLRISGGGECNAWNIRKAFVKHRQLQIFRAEIMAPLRHAMRLVNGEQRDARLLQKLKHARHHQTFGCYVK